MTEMSDETCDRIDTDGYLVRDGVRVPAEHPRLAVGTDCLAARPGTARDGFVEWDCGCRTPAPAR